MRFVTGLIALMGGLVSLPAAAQTAAPAAPPVTITDPANTWLLDLASGGRVTIALRPDVAPKMVERIKTLTRQHFYDGLTFHRVLDAPYPLAQGGDPKGDGSGGSSLPNVPAEFNDLPHTRGAVAAARAQDNDSANSQFYIMMEPFLAFDHRYTVFGRVIGGMSFVDAIHKGDPPADPTHILHAYIASDNPPPYMPAPVAPPPTLAPVTLPDMTTPAPATKVAPAPAKRSTKVK